jgi:Protein of unknown function (DUF2510)
MPDVYPCPECGNEETEWGKTDPPMRVCRPPKGCGLAWRVPDGPVTGAGTTPTKGAGPTQPPPPSKNAGWYKDPFGTGKRYWDGSVWTEHTAV